MDRELIWIVGGGPSAGDLDLGQLKNGFSIGVNDAAFHKRCDAYFSNDHNYARDVIDQIVTCYGEAHVNVRPEFIDEFEAFGVTVWERRYVNAPTLEAGRLASGGPDVPGCSGWVALNLAAQFGAKRVVLFGYDFWEPYTYFFNPDVYPRHSVPGVIESFRAVAPWYADQGIEIVNANTDSAIDAFPKITRETAYRHWSS